MTKYYSATERAFTFSEVHGTKTYMGPDPDWVRPTKKMPDPKWQPPMIEVPDTEAKVAKGEKRPTKMIPDPSAKRPLVEVPDEEAKLPMVEIRNPRIPDDAVEVSEEDYAALMEAQKFPTWNLIEPDKKGYPRAVPAPEERLDAQWRGVRDRLIEEMKWRYERHERESRLGMKTTDNIVTLDRYVQELADLPAQKGWPRKVALPQKP